MPKPRRKSEIRAAALREVAMLRNAAAARVAFLKPRPRSWHDVFLDALKRGRPIGAAAKEAGMSKSGVYKARIAEPGFRDAWNAAIAEARARKRQERAVAPGDHWRARLRLQAEAIQRCDETIQRESTTLGRCALGPQKVDNPGVRTRALAPTGDPRYRGAS